MRFGATGRLIFPNRPPPWLCPRTGPYTEYLSHVLTLSLTLLRTVIFRPGLAKIIDSVLCCDRCFYGTAMVGLISAPINGKIPITCSRVVAQHPLLLYRKSFAVCRWCVKSDIFN